MIFLAKSKKLKASHKKSILDQILLYLENYLPTKNKRVNHKEMIIDSIRKGNIKQITKFASISSKSITPNTSNTKITFYVGNWALPYMKLLKQIGLIK